MANFNRVSLLALLVGGLLALGAFAQEEPPRAEFEEEIEVTEVLLDVLVTDSKGNVIIGLGKDDFIVEENGEPVDIQSVTFYSSRRLVEPVAALERRGIEVEEVPEDRYFIVFIHNQRTTTDGIPDLLAQQIEAGRKLREWVTAHLQPADFVAVTSYDFKLKVHQDFTRDRGRILQAIDDAVIGKDPGNTWPSRRPENEELSLLAHLPPGKQLRKRTTRIYSALTELARAAGHVMGRKNLLLFTFGFGNISEFGPSGVYREDVRYYPPMVQALNDNNVAVYAIDLMPPTVRHVLGESMMQLAQETGGRYFYNFVNFITPLQEISEETSGYYLLAYRSRRPVGSSGYQKVEVRTHNPEFRVKAREGYLFGDRRASR